MSSKNTFFKVEDAVEDLVRRYHKFGSILVAVDFDGTIYNYSNDPSKDYTPVHDLLKECAALGFKIVIYTARNKRDFPFVLEFCDSIDLIIDGINEDLIELKYPTSGKIYYNIFLDDKAGLYQAFAILEETVRRIKTEKK